MRKSGLILAVVWCLVGGRAGLGAQEEAGEFWRADRVHVVHVRVSGAQWQVLQPVRQRSLPRISASAIPRPSTQPSTRPVLETGAPTQETAHRDGERLGPNFYGLEYAYVKAPVEFDGVALKDVGFRLRGNSSYSWKEAAGFKRPFKLDFNRFVDKQKFSGLTSVFLNNNAYDPSQLRETLAYETFRQLGVPAPRTSFALVYLTIEGKLEREYLGLYTLIEDIDTKAFLKEHFGSAKGLLLKPWSIRGLPYFGEEWKAYEPYYNSRTEPTAKLARRAIEFIKLVNYADDATFAEKIEEYLDVDEFLRLVAGDVMLANLDTFLYTGHNFYMYLSPEDGRFRLMPWDMNLSFGNYTSAASIEQHLHLSIMRPHVGEMKLIDRLVAIPKYNQMYRGHFTGAMERFFNPEQFAPRMDAFKGVLARAEEAAEQAWRGKFEKGATRPVKIPPRPAAVLVGWQGGAAIDLKTFVARRVEQIKAQLAGETEGYWPGYRRAPLGSAGVRAGAAYGNVPLVAFAVMRGADGNYDSKLTGSEVAGAVRWFFVAADAGKQGWVDEAKLAGVLERMLRQVRGQREGDRGGNRGRGTETARAWAGALLKAADGTKAGRVGLEAMLGAAQRAFEQADKDRSGRLDDQELLQLIDALAAAAPVVPAATTRPVRGR